MTPKRQDRRRRRRRPASIALLWKPAAGARRCHPGPQPRADDFPSVRVHDARSRRTTAAWAGSAARRSRRRGTSATTDAAIETAAYIATRLDELADAAAKATIDRARSYREFCRTFAERAFRRPLDDELAETLRRPAVRRGEGPGRWPCAACAAASLKSPRFLYPRGRARTPTRTTWPRGSRSPCGTRCPTTSSSSAARDGKLSTREQVAAQAERMVSDLRTPRRSCGSSSLTWLKVDPAPDLSQGSASEFPGFDAEIDRRPADVARAVPRRGAVSPTRPTSAAALGRRRVPQRPARANSTAPNLLPRTTAFRR